MPFRVFYANIILAATVVLSGCARSLPGVATAALEGRLSTTTAARSVPIGDVFRYAGSMTTSSGGVPLRAAVSQTVTVTATPYPYAPQIGAVDFHSVETDNSGGTPSVWTSDAWRGWGAASGGTTPYVLYGSRANDAAGDTYLDRYPTPQTLDQQPERNGASWSNGATLMLRETDADGTVANVSYAASGAYVENARYATACGYGAPCALEATVTPAGAARYRGSLLTASGIDSIVLSAPRDGQIAIAYTYPGGYQQSVTVAAWFSASAPLYAESDSIRTGVAFPKACAVPARFGTTGNVVVRNVSQVDPAAGTSESQQTQSYTVPVYGTVCAELSETVLTYYDYANANFSSTPLATNRVSETLSLRSASLAATGALQARVRWSELQLKHQMLHDAHRALRALGRRPTAWTRS
jgi:hypothetical protein